MAADDKALLDQLLRLKAEFENYRKRVDRDRPQWERAGKSRLLERLLPLYDVLLSAHEAVLRHKENSSKAPESSPRAWSSSSRSSPRSWKRRGWR